MSDGTDGGELVAPQTLKGFQDLLPEDAIARERLVEKIKRVYERYGFVPIDTPVLEYLVTLVGTGGEETNKQLFRLESPEGEPIAMRFDLTVPFARLIAQYPDKLKLPFRRYHIGPVFRAEDPRPGRFRQFTQFDIDAAGSDSVGVDAEIIAAMCAVMREIGLRNPAEGEAGEPEYRVLINNRKLVDALLEGCGITAEATVKHVLRVVDKLQKVGLENVRKELGGGRIDESGDPIPGVGLPPATIDRITAFITGAHQSRADTIASLSRSLPDSDATRAALREMQDLADALKGLGVTEGEAVFDPSLARGLDYYTGPVFEAVLLGGAKVGSVMGGGRYDGLVRRFLRDPIPATGASIGVDRLVSGMKAANKLQTVPTTVGVIILPMPGVPTPELLALATELRGANIPTVVYFGKGKTRLSDQLAYANANRIAVAVIIGENELKRGVVSIKDLKKGMEQRADIQDRKAFQQANRAGQVEVPRGELLTTVRSLLGLSS
jgi:histidyl-tRNA synthetase